MLGADIRMIERLGFFARQRENLLHARRVGNVANHLCLRSGADLLLDLHADRLQIEPHLLEDVDSDALAKLDQTKQKMLGPDVIMVKPVGFLAGERQDLLGAGGKIIHRSMER